MPPGVDGDEFLGEYIEEIYERAEDEFKEKTKLDEIEPDNRTTVSFNEFLEYLFYTTILIVGLSFYMITKKRKVIKKKKTKKSN